MSNYVVTANYLDRSSSLKWLVRGFDETTEDTIPVKSLKLRGVIFGRSNKSEEGFGCRVVANVESGLVELGEKGFPVEPGFQELRFDGWADFYFADDKKRQPQKQLSELILLPTGKMWAKV